MDYNIYWDDLKPETQADLIDNGFNPDERNVEYVPIAVLMTDDE